MKKSKLHISRFLNFVVLALLLMSGVLVIVPEEGSGALGIGLDAELVWDNAPFEQILTSVVYDDELYVAGKKGQEKIYKTADGENWEEAFSQKTTYEWRSSVVFKDALYFGSCEDTGSTWSATIWRSTDGSTLQKIYEKADAEKNIPTRFSVFGDTLFVGINNPNNAMILKSEDGENWEEAYSSTEYDAFADFAVFNTALYVTAGAEYNGGAVFRSSNGAAWEKVVAWNDGSDRWTDAGRGIIVFKGELYVGLNGERDPKWVRVFKSSDGEIFNEMWYYSQDYKSSTDFSVYRGRLYLTFSGDKDQSVGGEIRVLDDGEFKLLKAGKGGSEHHFHGHALFDEALYIAGGSGKGGSTDGFVYRIVDDGLDIDLVWDNAPFEQIITSVVYNHELYVAGKKGQETIYKTSDGETWDEAFPQKTTYEWRTSLVFKEKLYFGSIEEEGGTWRATIWRSTDGSSLQKIYEKTDSEKIIPSYLGKFHNTLYVGITSENALILKSEDGENWVEVFSTEEYGGFFGFAEYNDAFYATAAGEYDGGALFKSHNGEDWEKVTTWDASADRWTNAARRLLVFEDELYVVMNGDKESSWVKVLKSSDGEQFHKVWYYSTDYKSSPTVAIYRHRLYLTMSGDKDRSVGGEIRVFEKGEFRRLKLGKSTSEHHFHGLTVFNEALYIGGGSGTGGSTDGFVYRITDVSHPFASIDAITPNPAHEGAAVQFTGHGTTPLNTLVRYVWSSSIDGEFHNGTDSDVQYSDLSAGTHTISLRVQNSTGTWSKAETIKIRINAYPLVMAGDDIHSFPHLEVQFNGQATDADGAITYYEWDFDGNGIYDWSSSENGLARFIYNNPGQYTAILRVTDTDGAQATDSVLVSVDTNMSSGDDEVGFVPGFSIPTTLASVILVGGLIAVFRKRR